ncbi:MAG: hypothetical protein COV99_04185 [Bacteroidetes bacterium CG12_big_fil_rev_8_21_14_0_65_60_17]|nr:MAG: hypothetical protein COV99_04185 [Bacteroidetes bacterium CG12_big_fil_rev_8_21_14_0_65_60_17]
METPKSEHRPQGRTGTPEADPEGVAQQSRQFFSDIREWVELRVELFQVDLEERIQDVVNRMAQAAIVILLIGLALLFLAMAAAFALGEWTGSTALGFLIVAVIGFLVAVVVKSSRPRVAPRLFREGDESGAARTDKKLPEHGHAE